MKRPGVGCLQTGNLQISPGAKLADSTVGRFEPEGAGVEVCSGALRTRPGALAAAVANPIIHPGTLGAGPGSLTPSVDGSGRAASGTWAPRPTYIVSEPQLRQTIRCATEGDTIEVQRLATQVRVDQRHVEGIEPQLERRTLWQRNPELLQGCHPLGVELNANMDIIGKDNRQIIEIIHEQHADRPNLGPQQGMSVRSALEAIEDPGMPGA